MKPLPKAIDVSMQGKRKRAPNLLEFTDPTAQEISLDADRDGTAAGGGPNPSMG